MTTAKDNTPVDPSLGVAYQRAGDIRRMLNERTNAAAYGDTDRVDRIDRDLKDAGFTGDPAAFAASGDRPPAGRVSGKPDVTSPVVSGRSPSTGSGVTSSFMSTDPNAGSTTTGSGSTGPASSGTASTPAPSSGTATASTAPPNTAPAP